MSGVSRRGRKRATSSAPERSLCPNAGCASRRDFTWVGLYFFIEERTPSEVCYMRSARSRCHRTVPLLPAAAAAVVAGRESGGRETAENRVSARVFARSNPRRINQPRETSLPSSRRCRCSLHPILFPLPRDNARQPASRKKNIPDCVSNKGLHSHLQICILILS